MHKSTDDEGKMNRLFEARIEQEALNVEIADIEEELGIETVLLAEDEDAPSTDDAPPEVSRTVRKITTTPSLAKTQPLPRLPRYAVAQAATRDLPKIPRSLLAITEEDLSLMKQSGITGHDLIAQKLRAEREAKPPNTEGLSADELRVAKSMGVSPDKLRAAKRSTT